jgi:hypothetical protein
MRKNLSKDLSAINQGRVSHISRVSRVSSQTDLPFQRDEDIQSIEIEERDIHSKFNQSKVLSLPSVTTDTTKRQITLAQKL